ncbi:hypothetical protein HW555_012480 [Spodoptera exigua]|uniref:Uncharacterized protein n=1 Tax=Spodoptera exigua TaxID=7107 RepID=A0A835G6Z4_SPOEX|nr:hypothetical protein HW555_012480 [Spodoptera exigua]
MRSRTPTERGARGSALVTPNLPRPDPPRLPARAPPPPCPTLGDPAPPCPTPGAEAPSHPASSHPASSRLASRALVRPRRTRATDTAAAQAGLAAWSTLRRARTGTPCRTGSPCRQSRPRRRARRPARPAPARRAGGAARARGARRRRRPASRCGAATRRRRSRPPARGGRATRRRPPRAAPSAAPGPPATRRRPAAGAPCWPGSATRRSPRAPTARRPSTRCRTATVLRHARHTFIMLTPAAQPPTTYSSRRSGTAAAPAWDTGPGRRARPAQRPSLSAATESSSAWPSEPPSAYNVSPSTAAGNRARGPRMSGSALHSFCAASYASAERSTRARSYPPSTSRRAPSTAAPSAARPAPMRARPPPSSRAPPSGPPRATPPPPGTSGASPRAAGSSPQSRSAPSRSTYSRCVREHSSSSCTARHRSSLPTDVYNILIVQTSIIPSYINILRICFFENPRKISFIYTYVTILTSASTACLSRSQTSAASATAKAVSSPPSALVSRSSSMRISGSVARAPLLHTSSNCNTGTNSRGAARRRAGRPRDTHVLRDVGVQRGHVVVGQVGQRAQLQAVGGRQAAQQRGRQVGPHGLEAQAPGGAVQAARGARVAHAQAARVHVVHQRRQRVRVHVGHAAGGRRGAGRGQRGQRLQQVGRRGRQHGAMHGQLGAAGQQHGVVVLPRLAQRVQRAQHARRRRLVAQRQRVLQRVARRLRAVRPVCRRPVTLLARRVYVILILLTHRQQYIRMYLGLVIRDKNLSRLYIFKQQILSQLKRNLLITISISFHTQSIEQTNVLTFMTSIEVGAIITSIQQNKMTVSDHDDSATCSEYSVPSDCENEQGHWMESNRGSTCTGNDIPADQCRSAIS